jgi:hypothetical protein
MGLIGEATCARDLLERQMCAGEELARLLESALDQPPMWRNAKRLLERAREVTRRQTACFGELGERHAAVEPLVEELLGAPLLARRQAATNAHGLRGDLAVGAREVMQERGRDVIDLKGDRFVWSRVQQRLEREQEVPHDRIREADTGLMPKISEARCLGFGDDGLERGALRVEGQVVEWPVVFRE